MTNNSRVQESNFKSNLKIFESMKSLIHKLNKKHQTVLTPDLSVNWIINSAMLRHVCFIIIHYYTDPDIASERVILNCWQMHISWSFVRWKTFYPFHAKNHLHFQTGHFLIQEHLFKQVLDTVRYEASNLNIPSLWDCNIPWVLVPKYQ